MIEPLHQKVPPNRSETGYESVPRRAIESMDLSVPTIENEPSERSVPAIVSESAERERAAENEPIPARVPCKRSELWTGSVTYTESETPKTCECREQ